MFEAYKVSLRLSLVSNVGSGLAVLSHQFAKLNGDTKRAQSSIADLEKSLNNIKRLGLVGGAMAGVGFGALSLFRAPLEAAKEYETAHARFKTLNWGEEVNKQADAFARGTQAFGASSTQLMETLRESIGMFGDIGIAKQVAPLLAELNAANSAMFQGKVAGIDEGAVRSIMRFNDMRGLTNSATDFKRGLDLAQKLVTGSGGALKFTDLEQLAKRGGAAFKGLSDDGVMMLATVMQEQGGSATGTALMSLYQNLVAGRTTKKAMAMLENSGLAKLGYVTEGTVGDANYKTRQVIQIKDEELLRTNPGQWLMTDGVDAAKKSGAKTDSEVIAFLNDLISNRTGSNLAATFTTQSLQAMRDFKLVSGAMGAQQTISTFKGTTQGSLVEMQAKWSSALSELGTTVLPIATRAIEGLNAGLSKMIEFAQKHPMLTEAALLIGGATAATAALGGVALLATSGIKALTLATGTLPGNLAIATTAINGLGAASVAAFGVLDAIRAVQTGESASYDAVNIIGAVLTGDKNFDLGAFIYDKTHQNGNGAAPVSSALPLLQPISGNIKEGSGDGALTLPSARWELSKPALPVVQQAQHRIEKQKADLGVFAGAQNAPNYLPSISAMQESGASRYIGTTKPQVNLNVTNKLDRHGLATMVTEEQTRSARRPTAGISTFDPTMSLMPVGF